MSTGGLTSFTYARCSHVKDDFTHFRLPEWRWREWIAYVGTVCTGGVWLQEGVMDVNVLSMKSCILESLTMEVDV